MSKKQKVITQGAEENKGKDVASEELKTKEEALARAFADYQNLVNRVEREKIEIYTRASKSLIEELLPVLDLLKRAQNHLGDPGLAIALQNFEQVIARAGVEKIEVKSGDQFDAMSHEVVETIEGKEPGIIAKVLEDGFKWKDGKVLRPVKVEVYKNLQ